MAVWIFHPQHLTDHREMEARYNAGEPGIVQRWSRAGCRYEWAAKGSEEWMRARVHAVANTCKRNPAEPYGWKGERREAHAPRRLDGFGPGRFYIAVWVDSAPVGCVSVDCVTGQIGRHNPDNNHGVLAKCAADLAAVISFQE